MRATHIYKLFAPRVLAWLLLLPSIGRADHVVTLEGDLLQGKVGAITPAQELLLAGQDPWPLEQLRAIVPAEQATDVDPAPYTIWLTNGSRFSTRVIKLAEENYELDNPILGRLDIPIDLVWAVRIGRPDPESRFARAVRDMAELDEDVIYATGTGTGEFHEIRGLIEELNDEGLTFDQEGELKVLPADQFHAVLLASPFFEPETPDWITSRLSLSDGSLISGNIIQLEESQISIQLGEGMTIDLPWAQIRRLTVESDLLHYLSDLEPTESSTEAIYAYPRTWKRDLNVRGNPLRLGQDRFEKGVGVGAGTAITFQNDGEYRLFTATIGLDVERGGAGHCTFVVSAGKEELFRQQIRGRDKPQFIKLDIEDHEEITLSVEPGILGLDLGDDANWCEACFLQAD